VVFQKSRFEDSWNYEGEYAGNQGILQPGFLEKKNQGINGMLPEFCNPTQR
jgi:hypothetical protein